MRTFNRDRYPTNPCRLLPLDAVARTTALPRSRLPVIHELRYLNQTLTGVVANEHVSAQQATVLRDRGFLGWMEGQSLACVHVYGHPSFSGVPAGLVLPTR